MSAHLDLSTFTSDWRVEEQGYQDPAIREMAEAIEHTEEALDHLRGGSYRDLAERGEDLLENTDVETYRTALQASCLLYGAVQYRLAVLAVEMGRDPEEVLDTHV